MLHVTRQIGLANISPKTESQYEGTWRLYFQPQKPPNQTIWRRHLNSKIAVIPATSRKRKGASMYLRKSNSIIAVERESSEESLERLYEHFAEQF